MRQTRRMVRRNAPVLFVILTILSTAPAFAQKEATSREYANRLAKADELLAKEDFTAAMKAYRQANKAAGGASAKAWLGLGVAAFRSGRYADAQAAARELLDLPVDDMNRMAGYDLLGSSILRSNTDDRDKLTEAEQAFRHIQELGVDSPEIRLNLAVTLQKLGHIAESLTMALELLSAENQGISDQARIGVCRARRILASQATAAPLAGPVDGTAEQPVAEDGGEEPIDEDASEETSPEETSVEGTVGEPIDGVVEKPSGIYRVAPPVRIYAPQPMYPRRLLEKRIQGKVIVQAILTKEGCLTNLKVLNSPHEALSEAALKAFENWTFRPATLKGKAVDVYYNATANFGFTYRRRGRTGG